MDKIKYIRQTVSREELLTCLAEETAELGQAALKYRRTLVGDNPTPLSEEEAYKALLEEVADVELCIWALELTRRNADLIYIGQTTDRKLGRWVERLKAALAKEGSSR